MYIVAVEEKEKSRIELSSLVQPNLDVLSDAWLRAIKDHGILKLPASLLEDVASKGKYDLPPKTPKIFGNFS